MASIESKIGEFESTLFFWKHSRIFGILFKLKKSFHFKYLEFFIQDITVLWEGPWKILEKKLKHFLPKI